MTTMTLPSPDTERSPRSSVMLNAHVFRVEGSAATRHRVVNLSATGACIVAPEALEQGQQVLVTIGPIDHVASTVVWICGGLAGLRFHRPIDAVAARRRRADATVPPPAAGWLAALGDAYRR